MQIVMRLLFLLAIAPTTQAGTPRPAAPAATTQALPSPQVWIDRLAAEVSSIKDPRQRMNDLGSLAELQARAGDRAGLDRSVREFRTLADSHRGDKEFASLLFGCDLFLARSYARLGDVAGARAALASARQANPSYFDDVRLGVVKHVAEGGAFDLALELTQQAPQQASSQASSQASPSPEAAKRAQCLLAIATAQAAAGQAEPARKTFALAEHEAREAMRLKQEDAPYDTLLRCVAGLIEAGEIASAEKMLLEIPQDRRTGLHINLAKKCFEQKDQAGYQRNAQAAFELLRSVPRESTDMVLGVPELAALQVRAGDADGAAKTRALYFPDVVRSPILQAEVLYQRALDDAIAGDVAASSENLQAAHEAEKKAQAGGFVVMPDMQIMFQSCVPRIAQAHIDAGHPAEAMRLLQTAGKETGGEGFRVELMGARAATGDINTTQRDLEKIEAGVGRDLVTIGAVRALVRSKSVPDRWSRMQQWEAAMPTASQRIIACRFAADELLKSSEKK